MNSGGNTENAAAWGNYIAALVHQQCGNDLRQIISTWQWRLLIVEKDESNFPLPRLGVWEGESKTIRLFHAPLREHLPQQPEALARACAHEMFHGLVATSYQNLPPSHAAIPRLTQHEEEIAAHAFATTLTENFRLTFEA